MLMRSAIINALSQYDDHVKRYGTGAILREDRRFFWSTPGRPYDAQGIERLKEISQYKINPGYDFVLDEDKLYDVINIFLDFTCVSQMLDTRPLSKGYGRDLYSFLTTAGLLGQRIFDVYKYNEALISHYPGIQDCLASCIPNAELIFGFPISNLIAEFGEVKFSALMELKKSGNFSKETFKIIIHNTTENQQMTQVMRV